MEDLFKFFVVVGKKRWNVLICERWFGPKLKVLMGIDEYKSQVFGSRVIIIMLNYQWIW